MECRPTDYVRVLLQECDKWTNYANETTESHLGFLKSYADTDAVGFTVRIALKPLGMWNVDGAHTILIEAFA